MKHKGKFTPINPQKYRGDASNIIYRSSWEKRVMLWLDKHSQVISWSSEEIVVPYKSPADGRFHRYFVDFYAQIRDRNGKLNSYLLEIKPKKQSLIESRTASARDRAVVALNHAKWQAANAYCKQQGYTFRVITEDDLFYNGRKK